jgi:hypothetical protein
MIKEQTNYQNRQLMRHNKKKYHYNACAVTMCYIIDNLIYN